MTNSSQGYLTPNVGSFKYVKLKLKFCLFSNCNFDTGSCQFNGEINKCSKPLNRYRPTHNLKIHAKHHMLKIINSFTYNIVIGTHKL